MDIKFVRKQFPGLNQNFIFMDNAGGSQILGSAIARIDDYLINTNVQLDFEAPPKDCQNT